MTPNCSEEQPSYIPKPEVVIIPLILNDWLYEFYTSYFVEKVSKVFSSGAPPLLNVVDTESFSIWI